MTWILSKKMMEDYANSHYSPEQAEVSLVDGYWVGERCAQWKSKRIPKASLSRDKTTEVLNHFQFGMIFAPLTENLGTDLLTSFREAFLAPISVPPVREPELKEQNQDFGKKWRGLSVKFDPDLSGWRTVHSSSNEVLPWSSVTLPKWGMMRNGELLGLITPPHLTSEIGSGSGPNSDGLWPTATSCDHATRFAQGGMPLGMAVRMWQTPTVEDAGREGSAEGRRKWVENKRTSGCRLRNQVQMFPTPTAADSRSSCNSTATRKSESKHHSGTTLSDAARLWRTPSSQEPGISVEKLVPIQGGEYGGMNRHFDKDTGRCAQLGLEQQVKLRELYPTPGTNGIDGGQNVRRASKLRGTFVPGGKLNPDWVEWLMNWPVGWTRLKDFSTSQFLYWGFISIQNEQMYGLWFEEEVGAELDGEFFIKTAVPRLGEKIESRTHRLKSIGNGQVPVAMVLAWDTLSNLGK